MKTNLTSHPSSGPRLRSSLRAGIDIKDLNSFSHALIEEIAINDPHLIPDKMVKKCSSGFKPALMCVSTIKTLGNPSGILSGALNTVAEQCKQSGLGASCDQWGDLFGVSFGHG